MKHFALVFILGLGACQNTPPPDIGLDLPGDVREATAAFDARIQARFPVGTEEFDLILELVNDGFELSSLTDGRRASYDQPQLVCLRNWRVLWTAHNGRVTEIEGHYSLSCL